MPTPRAGAVTAVHNLTWQFGALQETEDITLALEGIAYEQLQENRLSEAGYKQFIQLLGPDAVERLTVYFEEDPLLNLRFEVENNTAETQFFAFQARVTTDVTAGPTFKDAFANLELIDANEDDFALVSSVSTFFEVVSDTGEATINGSANLGEVFSFVKVGEGKQELFSQTGAGPDSDAFGGPGFNVMRFSASGYLSAGDKVVITGMGAYATDEAYLPDRYEAPANVPEPAAGVMLAVLLGVGLCRRRSA